MISNRLRRMSQKTNITIHSLTYMMNNTVTFTLSTPIFLNAAWRILKFWIYSCSRLVLNLILFTTTLPVTEMWNYHNVKCAATFISFAPPFLFPSCLRRSSACHNVQYSSCKQTHHILTPVKTQLEIFTPSTKILYLLGWETEVFFIVQCLRIKESLLQHKE